MFKSNEGRMAGPLVLTKLEERVIVSGQARVVYLDLV